ncbi:hypothetical protein KP509_27G008000 [Ceratopteris richardii]|uniref:Uncharacterized protein n=1 Tax=Ceratopteris richardii TaxID=49495 RepID=A0A8T2RGA1_CERRI|nr:hypothetical protein KP509_27G008000 [Ceratopteris richardii]
MASRTLKQQVRAREMEFERQQAQKLKEKKEKKRRKLIDCLNKLWREEQKAKIAALAEQCVLALLSIGRSHAAAKIFVQEQERMSRKLTFNPNVVAKRQKKAKDFAAKWERSLGRFSSHKAKFKILSKQFSRRSSGLLAEHDVRSPILQPSDYKHTFLHSRLFVNTDDGEIPSSNEEMDAWKAAELQRQMTNRYRLMQMEIRRVMDKRKALRGQLAGSLLRIEKAKKMLEQENLLIEEAEKESKINISCHQVAEVAAKTQHPGGGQLLQLPHNQHPYSNKMLEKSTEELRRSSERDEDVQVPQELTITNYGNKQTLHISALDENSRHVPKVSSEVKGGDYGGASIVVCGADIKISLKSKEDDSCNQMNERTAGRGNDKFSPKALSSRRDRNAPVEQKTQPTSDKRKMPTDVATSQKESSLQATVMIPGGNKGRKMEKNPKVAQVKSAKRVAGVKSILHSRKDQERRVAKAVTFK